MTQAARRGGAVVVFRTRGHPPLSGVAHALQELLFGRSLSALLGDVLLDHV